jgi:hypothetical protein
VKDILRTGGLLLLLVAAMEREARAYADPGSGALIWQSLIAGVVGGMFFVRRFTNWLRSKMRSGE